MCFILIFSSPAYAEGDEFSFSFAVLDKGREVYSNDGNRAYLAGSVAKSFAAELVEVLCEEGILNRDTVLYGLTLEQILNQENGFFPYSGSILGFFSEDRGRKLDVLKSLPQGKKQFSYQNITFSAIEELVEKATGLSYREALNKYVLKRAGLFNTGSGYSYFEAQSQKAAPLFQNGQAVSSFVNRSAVSFEAAAGLVTTAEDLAKWTRYIYQRGRLRDAHSKGTPVSENTVYYHGWFIDGDTAYSPGTLFGTGAVAVFSQSTGDGIIIMCTGDTSSITALARELLEGKPYSAPSEGQSHELPYDDASIDISGLYENPLYGVISVSLENGGYYLRMGKLQLPLEHIYENLYRACGFSEDFWRMVPGLRYIYFETEEGNVTGARIEGVYSEGLGVFKKL